jgi:hypothetical protein
MFGSNYEMYCPESYSGTGTFDMQGRSHYSDEDLEDTIRVREVSFMSMYQGDDSIPADEANVDEFENLRKF